jgi:hypothetical protein
MLYMDAELFLLDCLISILFHFCESLLALATHWSASFFNWVLLLLLSCIKGLLGFLFIIV